jgi:hypothetical protein
LRRNKIRKLNKDITTGFERSVAGGRGGSIKIDLLWKITISQH